MTPNSNILGGGTNEYELVLTSAIPYPMTGSSTYVHGIIFPLEPYTYKLEIATCNSCSSATTGYLAW